MMTLTWLRQNWLMGVFLTFGLSLGMLSSWWYNKPPLPWMEFNTLRASYSPGRPEIKTSGQYMVHNTCDPGSVIWRIEAVATDGQVAEYGPKEPQPSLSNGKHWYDSSIPLEAEIHPDGWAVRILVTCPGQTPETIASEPAPVDIKSVETPP